MTTFNEHQFEKRLQFLKDSQESIQSLSAWCLHNRQHHKKIVACWLRVLKKVKIEHRLTLFYLANDVIQYSKRKNYEFVESWGTALQRATTMVREEKVKQRILRIFKIWDERGIYDEAFITDLSGLLSTTTKRSAPEATADTSEFQPPVLIAKIQSCKKLEDDTDLKLKRLNESRLSVSDADALRSHLKDRRQGDDLVAEVDEGLNKMQEYMKALEREIKERNNLIELLEQAEIFYETQKGEAKVVANAYRNFGSRVKNLKKRLDELKPKLRDVSPVPSPDINAPSPSPDSDIELPGENENTADSTYNSYNIKETHPIKSVVQEDSHSQQQVDNCFSSFMNTSLPFDIQKSLFSDTSTDAVLPPSPPIPALDVPSSPPPVSGPSEGKPIEVITRAKPDEAFDVKEFLKTLISSGNSTTIIPGLDMDSSAETSETDALTTKQSLYTVEPELNTSTDYDYPAEVVSTPLQPPPMPPNLFPLEESPYGKYGQTQENEDSWNTKLPPKFPTWGDTASAWEPEEPEKTSEWMPVLPPVKVPPPTTLDTPESPPMYEKEGFSDPVEYDDSVVEPVIMSSSGDVDHRTLVPLPQINHTKENECHIPPIGKHVKDIDHRMFLHAIPPPHPKKDMDHRPLMPRKKDVDHRNLISLTGSPVRDHSVLPPPPAPPSLNWLKTDQDYRTTKMKPDLPPQGDQDYRLHQPHPIPRRQDETQDNVESVDMEMSDEEAVDMLENVQNPHMRDDGRHDKKFEFGSNVKSLISFNINSQAKLLASSPLNENKDESVQNRGKIYGCQKIPTISGVGGNVHSPRGMGPGFRPRGPPSQNPVNIKRFPPPNMRGFRHTLLLPPPPPPQLTPPESFNVPIEIKPQAEIEAQENALNAVTEEKEKQETVLEQPAEKGITDEKENLGLSTSSTEESDLSQTEKQNSDSVVGTSVSTDTHLDNNPLSPETEPVNGNETIEPLPQPVVITASPIQMPISMEGDGSEHWMNNELAELEQQSRTENTNNFRGRGIARPPFKNFMPRVFNPRMRPPWNGPRRGGPPPMRFPFRPPVERPFGRGGPRGGFRPPFRGNRGGNFGGW